jgi:hypothetical protein
MKNILIITVIIICSCISVAHAELSNEKRVEIEKMLRLTGMEKLMGQMKSQIISALRKEIPDASEIFWTKFEQKMDVNELIEKLMPIYDKYYTLEDLKAVNAFYESPAGQRLLVVAPMAMQDAMKIGQEWGEKLGKEAATEAEQEANKK